MAKKQMGSWVNIIGSMALGISFLYLSISFFTEDIVPTGVVFLFMMMGSIATLAFSINYLNTGRTRNWAGNLGIIFGGIIGGIMILNDENKVAKKDENSKTRK